MNGFKLLVEQIAGDTVEYGESKPGEHYHLITVDHSDACIHDPRFDESGFHGVEPSYYGMTKATVDKIIEINSQLIRQQNELASFLDQSIDKSVVDIQKSLGVTAGDRASHHFSDDTPVFEAKNKVGALLASYALAEINSVNLNDQLSKKPRNPGSMSMG